MTKTSTSISSLTHYLQEIGKTPLLTPQEEKDLADRIAKGDSKARQRLLISNLRLVVSVAKKYVPGKDLDLLMDLIQEGNIGLMRAVDRYKSKFDTRFSTYGVYWIRQAVLRALKARRLVRLPENVFDRVLAMQKMKAVLGQTLGRTPNNAELAGELGLTSEEVRELELFSTDIVSLEQTIGSSDDEQGTLQDVLEDRDAISPVEQAQDSFDRMEIRTAIARLPIREQEILSARFGLQGDAPKTLEEIGEGFSISRERVRQLQNVALERLRHRRSFRRAR